jgi:signal peptidase I
MDCLGSFYCLQSSEKYDKIAIFKAKYMDQTNITEPELKTPEKNNMHGMIKKYLTITWDFLKIIIIAAVIVLPIRYFLFQPFIVKGDSMIPNFHNGDYLIVDEISYRFTAPQRGDVIVLKYPFDTSERFIKRIIGLPGETVQISNGKIDITKNGKDMLLNEKAYLPNLAGTSGNVSVTLGSDTYFVLGDNRPYSYDSRGWGTLPGKDIIGKTLFRVFPLTQIHYFTAPIYQ